MGVLEWLGAHLLGPLVNLCRALAARPRPDIRVIDVKATGGAGGRVDFSAYLQNRGTQAARPAVHAFVESIEVTTAPTIVDLLPNAAPGRVAIIVPRPTLGDLMPECNHATTLYGRMLVVEAADGKHGARATWREENYDPETDRARYDVQQAYRARAAPSLSDPRD